MRWRLSASRLWWIAFLLPASGAAAAERAAAIEWPQRIMRIITGPFAAIPDEQRAKWAAIAQDHGIKPVH